MIPVQLTIKGLYSYQEKQTIDFSQLTAAKLFGIFGSVGSGKSSILEAITFAIYGRTDRLNRSGDNRYYNMMNLKCNDLFIDFIFETGQEQDSYRVTVKGRRNSKKFEDVNAMDRTAYKKVGGEWMPVAIDSMNEVIGLSYENFKRTIIIPQGQFQEFLQLGNKDRTQMMKDLFNLSKYEFYYKVAALESKNNAQQQNIEGQLKQLGTINYDQLEIFENQLVQIKKDLEQQNMKFEVLQKQEEEFRQLQGLTNKLEEAEKELKALKTLEPEVRDKEKRMLGYEQCVLYFKHLLDALKDSSNKLVEREKQVVKDQAQLKKQEEIIAQLHKELDYLKPVYEKREDLRIKAGELTLVLRMKALEKIVENEVGRLRKGEKVCEQTIQNLENLRKDKAKQEALLKELRKKLPNWTLLANVKTWYAEKKQIEEQLKDVDRELDNNLKEVKEGQQSFSRLLQNPLFAKLPGDSDYSDCIRFLQETMEYVKEKISHLNERDNNLRFKAHLKNYADNLEEGAACPLCGSVHHPELLNAEDVREAQEQLLKDKRLMEAEQEKILGLRDKLNVLYQKSEFVSLRQKELSDRKSVYQKRMEEHMRRFVWDKYRQVSDLTKAFQEADFLNGYIEKTEAAVELVNKQVIMAEKNRDRYQNEVEKIRRTLAVNQTELKTIERQLKLVDANKYRDVDVADIEAEQARLLDEHFRIEKSYIEQSARLQELNKFKDTLIGSLLVNKNEMELQLKGMENLQKQVGDQLKKSSFSSIDEVRLILSEPLNIEEEKRKLFLFKEQLLQYNSLCIQLQKEMGSKVYDALKHQQLVLDMDRMKEYLTQKNQELGKVSQLLKKLQKDLQHQTELRKEMAALSIRAENIKTMKSLFKGSGFVNYVSSVYLQNLCNTANDRFFQLTRQKLSLEITPDNSFQVRDFMNGGKVRSVKTLSGGQTFQAALSLALALADNIQKITQSNQNFFFLDEGFGSLDKDSLSIVFDTLKSLRQENRIIGVISHVEEMQQEIDIHLRIENSEQKGSIVCPSWLE